MLTPEYYLCSMFKNIFKKTHIHKRYFSIIAFFSANEWRWKHKYAKQKFLIKILHFSLDVWNNCFFFPLLTGKKIETPVALQRQTSFLKEGKLVSKLHFLCTHFQIPFSLRGTHSSWPPSVAIATMVCKDNSVYYSDVLTSSSPLYLLK